MEINGDDTGSGRCRGNESKFVSTEQMGRARLDENIPECLLMEILIRLPVKQVFRFKVVCKGWLSIISDLDFMKMYVSHATSSPLRRWVFIANTMHYLDDYDHFDGLLVDIHSQDLKCPGFYVLRYPENPRNKSFKPLAVSNGIVLYLAYVLLDDRYCYGIFSPINRQWISIPAEVLPSRYGHRGFVARVKNGVLTSYRIVQVQLPLVSRRHMIGFHVFCSETGLWDYYSIHTEYPIDIPWQRVPTDFNGILHWRTYRDEIIGYDPYQKPASLHFIALPSDRDKKKGYGFKCLFDVHQGRLRYLEMNGIRAPPNSIFSLSVWILNDYSAGEWCLEHRMSSVGMFYVDIFSDQDSVMQPISFHPFDSDILYLEMGNSIFSYNIKTRKWEWHGSPDVSRIVGEKPTHWLWALLYVAPPWPVYIP